MEIQCNRLSVSWLCWPPPLCRPPTPTTTFGRNSKPCKESGWPYPWRREGGAKDGAGKKGKPRRPSEPAAEVRRSAAGGRKMDIALLIALLVVPLAFAVGVMAGRSRGPLIGFAMGLGMLVAGGIGYVGLVALTMSM